MYQHECKRCGNIYESGSRTVGYCSECRKERQKERNKAYQERKNNGEVRAIGSADVCANCGKPYIVKTGSQILCPECIEKGVKLTKSKSNTKYRDKTYDTVRFYVPKGEREKLKEFAADHNMSLNEFVNFSISLGKKELIESEDDFI